VRTLPAQPARLGTYELGKKKQREQSSAAASFRRAAMEDFGKFLQEGGNAGIPELEVPAAASGNA